MQQLTDPYRALGVARGATDAEIKAAHRKLVKRYHPDTGSHSETERFLRVQEAYRVLSDPLLRKEWDLAHAPGPIRADQAQTAGPPRRRRPPAPKPQYEPSETAAPPRPSAPPPNADPRTQPRSSRSYTWSASEVPWWEEASTRSEKQKKARQRPDKAKADANANGAPPPPPLDPNDVFNRSSGAAWSSAARAYFRKGEADLPRRGSFRRQGTQVMTAGRARSAAEAEARHRAAAAAAAAMDDVYATPETVANAMPGPHEGTTHVVRRAMPPPWPSLGLRMTLALVGWLPAAALIASMTDVRNLLLATALLGISLVLLVALPRVAYVAALSTLLVLVIGGIFVGGILLSGSNPSPDRLTFYVGAMLVVGYITTAAVIVVGPPSLRPWSER